MKRPVLLCLLLLVATTAVFSQTFRMDIQNEPLSKALNMLDLEVSFDAMALSSYSVSVSRTFENQEKALSWLLEGKPFGIEKIGNVFIIVPRKKQPQEDVYIAEVGKERFVFNGTVVSEATGELLEFAVVSFLNKSNETIITGITTDMGQFMIQTPRIPVKIKISCLGYETLVQDIHNLKSDLGVFALTVKYIQLNEAVVTNENQKMYLNSSTFPVTPQMQAGIDNALELLNRIPGAGFDKASNAVLLNHQENILLLADGLQHPLTYFTNLSPLRIQAIEVLYSLSGRFVSDDYAGVINFILKKDYTGYDIYVSNAASLNLSKTADNLLSKNHPSVGLICTTRKLNFFGAYEYAHENRNMASSKSLANNAYELFSISDDFLNDLYRYENHTFSGGINYYIKPLHTLGVQADYASGQTNTFQDYTMQSTDLSNNQTRIMTTTTDNLLKAHAFTGTLFYRGQITNRLHLFGDFSYSYYYNDVGNFFTQESGYSDIDLWEEYNNPTIISDIWEEYKNQTVINLEGKYQLSGRTSLEAGYSNISRQYTLGNSLGIGFFDYSEFRNKAYVYLSCILSAKAGLKFGVAPEHIRQRNSNKGLNYFRILPFLNFNYKISPSANLSTGYAANQTYPLLYQLSPMGIVVDTFLTQIGNPVLKFAVRHHAFAELSLWNKLKIMPQFTYVSDGISEIYTQKDLKLYRMFENINFREYSLYASYDQMLGTNIKLKNNILFYHSEALHDGTHNSVNGWTFHAEGDYYHPGKSFGVQLGYYRNMKKNILWQGYQMSDKDYWCISARKELWHNRISIVLSYIPPITFGVRYDSMKEIDMPLYKEKTTLNLESYNQMLLLKISFRLDRGGNKPAENRTDNRINERER